MSDDRGSTKPLSLEEVDNWPSLGPMNLDPQRVRDLLLELEGQRERAEKAEAQVAQIGSTLAFVASNAKDCLHRARQAEARVYAAVAVCRRRRGEPGCAEVMQAMDEAKP